MIPTLPPFLAILLYLCLHPAASAPTRSTPAPAATKVATTSKTQPFNFTYPPFNNDHGNSQFSYKDTVNISWVLSPTIQDPDAYTLGMQCWFANNSDPSYYTSHPPQTTTNLTTLSSLPPNPLKNTYTLNLTSYHPYNICRLIYLPPSETFPSYNATSNYPVFYITSSKAYSSSGGQNWGKNWQAPLSPYGPLMPGSMTAGMWSAVVVVSLVVVVMVGVAGE